MTCSGEAPSPRTAAAKCVLKSNQTGRAACFAFDPQQVATRQSAKKFYVIDKIVPLNTSDGEQLQLILANARAAYHCCMVTPPAVCTSGEIIKPLKPCAGPLELRRGPKLIHPHRGLPSD
jgi:hypothetical protein